MSRTFWSHLRSRLETAVADYPGIAGLCLHDLTSGVTVGINADEEFPAASTIKIHILTCLFAQAGAGAIDLDAGVRIDPHAGAGDSGILRYLDDPVELTWRNVAVLMIAVSDNTATNLCIDLCGMDMVNRLIADAGLVCTRLRRRMADWSAAATHDNLTTPAELCSFLRLLHDGWPAPGVAMQTLAMLRKPKEDLLGRAIGAGIPIANKPGRVPGSWSDAGLVTLARRPYVLSFMTKYDPAPDDCAAVALLRDLHGVLKFRDDSNELGHAIYSGQ